MTKQIIIRPIVSEKQSRKTEKSGNKQYGFVVDLDSNKIEIRAAIEAKFEVQVQSVRTLIATPKARRRFTKTGVVEGRTKRYKKAYITLVESKEITFFENV